MLGAIVGDIVGSIYEGNNLKSTEFPFFSRYCQFTDDSVLTFAVADALLDQSGYHVRREDLYVDMYHDWFCRYPDAGYGEAFYRWADMRERRPYGSFGNGSAMRVSPVGWAFNSLDEVVAEATLSAAVTHDHPEGIKGARAVASAIFLGRTGRPKAEIKSHLESTYGYDLKPSLDQIRPKYHFDPTCQGSVPQAVTAFLESTDFETAVRNGVSLGGDSDTIACMAGSIAEAFYGGVPTAILERATGYLTAEMRELIVRFHARFQAKK